MVRCERVESIATLVPRTSCIVVFIGTHLLAFELFAPGFEPFYNWLGGDISFSISPALDSSPFGAAGHRLSFAFCGSRLRARFVSVSVRFVSFRFVRFVSFRLRFRFASFRFGLLYFCH